jgi:hypothetical protein
MPPHRQLSPKRLHHWIGIGLGLCLLSLPVLTFCVLGFLRPVSTNGPMNLGPILELMLLPPGLLVFGLGIILIAQNLFKLRLYQQQHQQVVVHQQRYWISVFKGCLISAIVGPGLMIVLATLSILIATNFMGWWYSATIKLVGIGSSRASVEAMMGSPGMYFDCKSNLFDAYVRLTDLKQCQTLSLYYQNQGNEQWEIAYDRAERVRSIHHFKR